MGEVSLSAKEPALPNCHPNSRLGEVRERGWQRADHVLDLALEGSGG